MGDERVRAEQNGDTSGVPVGRRGLQISHLLFYYDNLLFVKKL